MIEEGSYTTIILERRVSPENSEVLIKALNALTELLQIGGTLIALLPSPLSSPQFLALKIKK